MPLKAFIRGYDFAVVPVTWTNRRYGESKLDFREMGSRYVFIILYVWLEYHLSHGDYRRQDLPANRSRRAHGMARASARRGR
jgi:dolichol-phosphate mannosyltransferase